MSNYLCIKFLCQIIKPGGNIWFVVQPVSSNGKHSLPFNLYPRDDDNLRLPMVAAEYFEIGHSLIEVTRIKYLDEDNCLLFCRFTGAFERADDLFAGYDLVESLGCLREYQMLERLMIS